MLILATDAFCVIVPCCSGPNTTDDFHLRKMCHFPPENLLQLACAVTGADGHHKGRNRQP